MLLREIEKRLWAEVAAGRGNLRVRYAPGAALARERARREELLQEVAEQIRACRKCPLGAKRTQAVPGEGNPLARVMFVGEAPGFEEDRQGRPFVGPAGQLLTRMIQAMGLRRSEVYIANVLKCRPPRNRNPEIQEIAACREHLRRQLELIRPQLVITLGSPAARWFLGGDALVSRVRGRTIEVGQWTVLPTFHPSYLLRQPEQRAHAWADLQVAMRLLGLPIPRRGQRRRNSE